MIMRSFWGLCFALLLSILLLEPSHPQVRINIPVEFSLIQMRTGIQLYRNPRGDVVQVIDLNQGASVEFHLGEQVGEGESAAYGGQSPLFKLQTLQQFWLELSQTYHERAFSVCNGQFFNLKNPSHRLLRPSGSPVAPLGETASLGQRSLSEETSPGSDRKTALVHR
ncbi:MAG: hypothetical protein WBB43_19490, partial [Limnoraphis sp.]